MNQRDVLTSYSIGVYPTLELLRYRPSEVVEVLIDKKGEVNKGLREILDICQENSIRVTEAPKKIAKLAKSEGTYCVGIFKRYDSTLDGGRNHLVLVNPSDMGNLGTIIRTCSAFDLVDIGIIKPACDVFDPKVIRSSMGAFFKLRVQLFTSFSEYTQTYNRKCYMFRTDARMIINEVVYEHPYSLVFGNEGSGLPTEVSKMGYGVKIPQSPGVDSLNLAIAVGITLGYLYLQKK